MQAERADLEQQTSLEDKPRPTNSIRRKLLAAVSGIVLALILLELMLRIYNPFSARVRGESIILPVYARYVFDNPNCEKLDDKIIQTRNSLGFRGRELPADPERYVKIIAVGGSTTECGCLSDGKTWPEILDARLSKDFADVWVNNAGLDGHSTFGHLILVRDHLVRLKPQIVLFLIGANDIERDDLNQYDSAFNKGWEGGSLRRKISDLGSHSELFCCIQNMSRYFHARQHGLGHAPVNLLTHPRVEIPQEKETQIIQQQSEYLPGYSQRIRDLIRVCKDHQIVPILLTQACLCGDAEDPATRVQMGTLEAFSTARAGPLNCRVYWKKLELYNDVTRRVGREEDVLVVDLAREMPKNSDMYYDFVHYTNSGSEFIAEVIAEKIARLIAAGRKT